MRSDKQPFSGGIARHLPAVAGLAGVSLLVAMMITPADPLSRLLAVIPIDGLALGAYGWGTRIS